MRALLLLLSGCALVDLAGESHRVGPLDWESCQVACSDHPEQDRCATWCSYAQDDPGCGLVWPDAADCWQAIRMGVAEDEDCDPVEADLDLACEGAPDVTWNELMGIETEEGS